MARDNRLAVVGALLALFVLGYIAWRSPSDEAILAARTRDELRAAFGRAADHEERDPEVMAAWLRGCGVSAVEIRSFLVYRHGRRDVLAALDGDGDVRCVRFSNVMFLKHR